VNQCVYHLMDIFCWVTTAASALILDFGSTDQWCHGRRLLEGRLGRGVEVWLSGIGNESSGSEYESAK